MYDHYREVARILMLETEMNEYSTSIRNIVNDYLNSLFPFIETYEKKHFDIGRATPEEILAFLMEQNDLSQYDLASELGGQPVVSDILNGKRKLTRDHIERLSKRFGISPATFFQSKTSEPASLNEPDANYTAKIKKSAAKKNKKSR
jgi:HTH-type transcriptional regulator/antitoxin HigA